MQTTKLGGRHCKLIPRLTVFVVMVDVNVKDVAVEVTVVMKVL